MDNDVLVDAAEDCILDYGTVPTRFDPSRGVSLERFLLLVAVRDVINRLRSESCRKAREHRYASEQSQPALFGAGHPGVDREFLSRLLALVPKQNERAALLLWLGGTGKTKGLAEALGFRHENGDRQRQEVRRFKDRIKRRVTRARDRQLVLDASRAS